MSTPSTLPDQSPEALTDRIVALGERSFRGKQILQGYYRRVVGGYDAMTDLPAALREQLATALPFDPLTLEAREDDGAGSTRSAYRLDGGSIIEAVLMREDDRRTVCISSQAGCAMACQFCASGLLGLQRNLTVGEIVAQVWHAQRELRIEGELGDEIVDLGDDVDTSDIDATFEPDAVASPASAHPKPRGLTNVVVMGVGEPLANTRALLPALAAICEPWGFGMSPRRITISTVGILPGIRKLAESGYAVNLAISLHAPDDVTRSRIIPTNDGIGGIEPLVTAGQAYFEATGREVTYEYILIPEINGGREHARALAALLKRLAPQSNVNVIPYNPVKEFAWTEPTGDQVKAFIGQLRAGGVNVHVRKKKGRRVNAACGQLRLNRLRAENAPQPRP